MQHIDSVAMCLIFLAILRSFSVIVRLGDYSFAHSDSISLNRGAMQTWKH